MVWLDELGLVEVEAGWESVREQWYYDISRDGDAVRSGHGPHGPLHVVVGGLQAAAACKKQQVAAGGKKAAREIQISDWITIYRHHT